MVLLTHCCIERKKKNPLLGRSHITTAVNKSCSETKNTGRCTRYTARYWKWQMVFHVSLTSSTVRCVVLSGPPRCEPLPLWGVLLGLRRKGGPWWTRRSIVRQLTVRECLVSAPVPRTRRSKPQWTSVHKRFRQRVRPSLRPVVECKQDRVCTECSVWTYAACIS